MRGDDELLDGLIRIGRSATRRGGEPRVLSYRPEGTVVRVGDVVVKAHAASTDAAALDARVRAATDPQLADLVLAPLAVGASPGRLVTPLRGRLVTAWPAGTPVDRDDPDAAPWEHAAGLLARLHRVALGPLFGPAEPPEAGGPARVARALARLHATPASRERTEVLEAATTLPPWARSGTAPHPTAAPPATLPPWARSGTLPHPPTGTPPHPTAAPPATLPPWARSGTAPHPTAAPTGTPPHPTAALVHGDWHLGQLIRDGGGRWRLIDVEDLGAGDPAWDLARPAAWFAAGLLPAAVWQRFLDAYVAAGGCALAAGDPWPALDVPARALVVQSAALAVVTAADAGRPLDADEAALVAACRRIADLVW